MMSGGKASSWQVSPRQVFERVSIGSGAWLGARSVVMAEVGEGAVVGAGAVVVDPVPPYTVVAGTPARPIRELGRSPGRE